MLVKVRDEETIYDIAIKSYGLNNAFKIIADNGIDIASIPTELFIDENFISGIPPILESKQVIEKSNIQFYTAKEGQSIYDVSLTTYASLDMVYRLMIDSNIDSTNESDLRNKTFIYNVDLQADSLFVKHLQTKEIVFSTLDASSIINTSTGYVDDGYVEIGFV